MLSLSVYIKVSVIIILIIYLFVINKRKANKQTMTFRSKDKINFTAFKPGTNPISDEETFKLMGYENPNVIAAPMDEDTEPLP